MKIILRDGRSLLLNAGQIAFILIACLTALNGFIDSLKYEFVDPHDWHRCTFLFSPSDDYADLIKVSFVAPPFIPADTSHWPSFIVRYYAANPYVPQDLHASSHITGLSILHITPITLMAHILIKKLILAVSPQFVVKLFYLVALVSLAAVCLIAAPTRTSALGVFFVLGLSYPFLMIVCRANMGALVGGITLPLFFYFILRRPQLWTAVACLTAASLFRPNVLFLCPVLLGLGFWPACLGSLVAAGSLALAYALFFHLDALFYPGYGLAAHLSALKSYTDIDIIGPGGDGFNNSAYGAIKQLICWVHGPDCSDIGGLLQRINLAAALSFSGLLLVCVYLYLQRRMPLRVFAFAALSCFVLATTIFGTYHLLVFAVFPLLFLHAKPDEPLSRADGLILLTSIFVLSPKNYWFIHGVSVETLLNPFMLGAALIWLLTASLNHRLVSASVIR